MPRRDRSGGPGASTAAGRPPAPDDRRPCSVCGRTIEWRARWARTWPDVRRCSDACRRRGLTADDAALEQAIRTLLDARAHGATICPSEAARRVDPTGWEQRMEDARMAARRLAAAGEVQMTQRGQVVDPDTARGPIRIRRTP